jgi:hypothetical protein
MSCSTTSIGTVFDPPLINYQKVDSSNSPSMPTTRPQRCTNEQLKMTVLTDAVSHVDAWKRTSIIVLQYPSNCQSNSRDKAQHQFLNHLTKYHTPAPMAKMIMQALDQWFSNLQPNLVPRLPTGPDIPNQHLHQLINKAFVHQNNIGWRHFLRGRLLLHWKLCIAEYYRYCQPGDTYNPNLWMTKTVDAVWDLFLVIWTARNGKLHGKEYD